jgi:hypothetical protein
MIRTNPETDFAVDSELIGAMGVPQADGGGDEGPALVEPTGPFAVEAGRV